MMLIPDEREGRISGLRSPLAVFVFGALSLVARSSLPHPPSSSSSCPAHNREDQRLRLTVSAPLPDVRLHSLVTVLGTDVALGREKELNVLLSGVEGGGKGNGGSHLDAMWDCRGQQSERSVSSREEL